MTGSADTVPVGAADPSQPCTAGTFAASLCQQAYGWNLDYVVDPNGNTQSYWYTQDTNNYSTLNGTAGTTVMPYVRASRLTRVDYGMRAGSELGSQAPLHVVLSYANRCTGVDCTGGSDIPTGLTCPAGGPCSLYSPTFYSDQRLTTVQSETLTGGAYHGADSWALAHTFPSPGDGTAPALWLGKVTHSGIDSTAGTTITDPSTVFSGQVLQNRVWVTDGLAPLDRYRITSILSPTGAVTTVAYSGADCTPTSLPASPQSNTRRCFPQWWTPTTPIVQAARMDWFQIYPVQAVSVDAGPGAPGSLTQTTTYTYLGAPAWRYPELKYRTDTASSKLSWSVLAGWSQVKTVTAASAATTTYLRGLDGTPANTTGGTVSATVTASDGTIVTDSPWFSGRTLETQSTLGDGGALLKVTSSFPWASAPTATGTTAVGSPTARHLGTGRTWSKSAVAAGWRNTNATTGYDSLGRPVWTSDQGDTGTTADDTCTTTAYATGTAANLLHLTAASNTYTGVCNADGTPAGNLLTEAQTFYDGNTAALPGTGYADPVHALPTGSQSASAITAQAATAWQPGPTVAYDPLGRPASSTDTTTGTARTTTTAYTPATGPATSVTTTNPLGWTATTTYDPVRGNTLKSTDANGAVTERAYDASGRPTATWSALRPRATNPTPSTATSYNVSNTLASWVKTTTVDNSGGTTDSYTLYDGLGRVRQTQTPALVGGTDLTDTFYGAAGAVSSRRNAYYTAAVQAGTLVTPTLAVPSTDHYDYDAAGRPTRTLHLAWDNQAEYETDTAYTGTDTTTVTGTAVTGAATAVTDARGHTTAKTTWHGAAASGAADTTNYAYDPLGNLARMTDQAGNTWTWTLDPLGREKSRTDPDTGTTTTAYDPSGRKAAVTDANNTATSSTYDTLDRVTGTTTTLTGQGAKALTSTTWDTPTKGRIGTQTRYNGPNQDQPVTTTYSGYNAAYQPGDLKLTLPAAFGALAGTYETTVQYGATGLPTITSLPAVGPLPGEAVQNAWNALDLPAGLASATGVRYAANASYNNLNLLGGYEQNDTNATGTGVDTMGDTTVQNTWDATTGLLSTTQAWNTAGTTTSDLGRTDYSYDTTGRITSTSLSYPTRATAPAPDRQCYSYDWANRLSQAWTTAATDCTAGFNTAAIGGPAPYAQSYTYTASGDRASTTRYNANGTTAVSEAYTYGNGGPHRLQNVARTTGTTTTTDTFAYDPAGQMTNRGGQALAYTPDGKLATTTGTSTVPLNPNPGAPTGTPVVSGASQTGTRYYTADGTLTGITDGTGTTALIGNATAYQPAATGPTTCTRTYTFAGHTVAQRTATTATTGSTTAFITSDTTNTAQTITTATTGNGTTPVTVTTRRTDPYGLTRAPTLTASGNTPLTAAPASATGPGSNTANPGAFSAATGYLTGTADAATALTHLGARDLDPVLGAFTSPDPVLKLDEAKNFSPYVYGEADAINNTDPSGLMVMGPMLTDGPNGGSWHGADANVETAGPYTPADRISDDPQPLAVAPQTRRADDNSSWLAGVGDNDETMAYIREHGVNASAATALRYLSFDASFVPGVGGLSAVGLDMWANSLEGKPAVDEGDGLYMAMTLGAGPLGKLGKVGASVARTGEVAAGAAIHGNSASSPAVTYLYRLYHEDGTYLKTGVSKNPFNRYGRSFMEDKSMEVLQSGNRREILNLERFIVERDPGPLNRERWAGAFRTDVP